MEDQALTDRRRTRFSPHWHPNLAACIQRNHPVVGMAHQPLRSA
jgi:hypothetical protein